MKVLSEANSLNVPKDVIQRNIKKAMDPVTADYKELTYEAYGTYKSAGRRVCDLRAHEVLCPRPWRACCAGVGGVGMIINCLSDNNNRATADVNMIVKKAGCTIASSGEQGPSRGGSFSQHEELRDQRHCTSKRLYNHNLTWRTVAGSVIFNFARKGRLTLFKEIDEDTLLELCIEADVDGDVSIEVYFTQMIPHIYFINQRIPCLLQEPDPDGRNDEETVKCVVLTEPNELGAVQVPPTSRQTSSVAIARSE